MKTKWMWLGAALLLGACSHEPVMVEDVYLSENNIILYLGETHQLEGEVKPADADNTAIEWSSSRPDIVSVSSTGLLTTLDGGSAVITALAADGSGAQARCQVSVFKHVTAITLEKEEYTLSSGGEYQLAVTVTPTDARNSYLKWSSDNPAVVETGEEGWIRTLALGKATVTAVAVDGSGCSASCSINVVQGAEEIVFEQEAYDISLGENLLLDPVVLPENTYNKHLTWTSDDESVARVDSMGMVSGCGVGDCHIIATAENGVTSQVTIRLAASDYMAVDLGLPSGTLWCAMNVGAILPSDYGHFYAWGETTSKMYYGWNDYKWLDIDTWDNLPFWTITRYYTGREKPDFFMDGIVDDIVTLLPEDDAAHKVCGGSWRMATVTEWEELMDETNCVWKWLNERDPDYRGVVGAKVTSRKNGNFIFLPAEGHKKDGSYYNRGSKCEYWTSSLSERDSYYAYYVSIDAEGHSASDVYRHRGCSIRPVMSARQ